MEKIMRVKFMIYVDEPPIEIVRVKPAIPRWAELLKAMPKPPEPAQVLDYAARKRQATPPWADLKRIKEVYKTASALTRKEKRQKGRHAIGYSVDHIIPLKGEKVSGLHVWENLQIIRRTENSSKKNRYQIDFE